MLIVQPDDNFPYVLSAPSTSLKPLKKYFGRIVSGHNRPFWGVVTTLRLGKEKSGGGLLYSVIAPEFLRVLTEEEVAAVRGLRKGFGASFEKERTPEPQDAE
jgi:hypothetical protein